MRTARTLLFAAVGASAQFINILSPAPNTQVTTGQQFTASIQFQDTTSSVDVIALVFGLKVAQPEGPDDLGQEIATVIAPKFSSTGPQGQFVQNVNLVIPNNVVNGQSGTFNLTCGEFLTLGAVNTPLTQTVQVPIVVSSG